MGGDHNCSWRYSQRVPRPIDRQRRDELLARALPYLAEHGLAGLSLRPLAAALGTSDRMLVHYFGSKDNLVGLVLTASRPDIPDLLARVGSGEERADRTSAPPSIAVAAHRLWADLTGDGPQRPRVRLLLEVMALALTQPDPYQSYAEAAVHDWIAPVAAELGTQLDLDDEEALTRATLLVSGLRGLALDHYLTRDRTRTDAAAHSLITYATSPGSARGSPGSRGMDSRATPPRPITRINR